MIQEKNLSLLLATNEVRALTLHKWYNHIPDELVSSYTNNSILIWGKNTYTECINKEYLKNAENIVISTSKDCQSILHAMNSKNKIVKVKKDVVTVMDYCALLKEKDIIVMGGSKVYKSAQTLKQVNRLIMLVLKGQEHSLPQLLNFPVKKVIKKEKLSDSMFFVEMSVN